MAAASKAQIVTDTRIKTVLRFLEMIDAQEFGELSDVLSSDLQFHFGDTSLDRDETIATTKMFYAAFPDLTHSPEEIFSADDRVVLRSTVQGTHDGEFQGIPPTSKEVSVGAIAIFRVADGKIQEMWEQVDMYGLMQQIGAVPSE